MAIQLNRVVIATTLGADAELRHTPNGSAVLGFRGASNRKYAVNGEEREETAWLRYSLFGSRAEKVAQYLTKGTTLIVEGRITQRTYEDKNGNKRDAVEIVVDNFSFVPRGNGGNGNGGGNRASRPQATTADAFDPDFDEVPF